MTIILTGLLLASAIAIIGCESPAPKNKLAEEISALKHEKYLLENKVEKSQAENQQLKQQLQTLSGLDSEVKLEHLYELEKIKVTRYTNLYDKDNDGKKEKLLVYIQPIDKQNDIVKASGTVDVELWYLNKKDEAMLGKWQVTPAELKQNWFATLITINYRLMFDVAEKITGNEEELVVKVTFTDYLSGKVFKQQKVIRP